MAIAPNGTLYIAWQDDNVGDNEIYVRRWSGSSWVEVGANSASGGGVSNNSGSSEYPSLAVTPDNTPYIAWRDDSGGDTEIYVRRWNGSIWEEAGTSSASGGGISNNSGSAGEPSMAIAPDGTPYVVWQDTEVYVRRWNGNSWEEVGIGSASGGGVSDILGADYSPSLAISSDSLPYIAWQHGSEIYVRRGPTSLEVNPTDLIFLVKVGSSDPATRTIAIDGWPNVITWSLALNPPAAWLHVTPLGGTTPSIISASAAISGLVTSHYTTTLLIDGGASVLNSPASVNVRLVVADEILTIYLPLARYKY